jgi:hypothetical protein
MPDNQPILELDRDAVEAAVLRATHSANVGVTGWRVSQLTGGREAESSIYRVDVDVDSPSNDTLCFILKIIRITLERRLPEHWNYWQREALAYQSGALAALPAGLTAPTCFGVMARDNTIWIWLECLAEQNGTPWSETEIEYVAAALGCFNGSYLVETAVPQGPWVSQGWLRHYVNSHVAYIERLPELRQHPLAGKAVDPQLLPDLLRLADERERFLNQLDRLPQVFCHQDAHRGNLFITLTVTGEKQLVAVDWSFAGIAAIGQELAPLLFTNRRMPNIYELATQQYLAGLRAVGWPGSEATIRWSSAISAALVYGVAMVGLFIGKLLDEQAHAELVEGFGTPIEQLPPRATAWVEFGLRYADLARDLEKSI